MTPQRRFTLPAMAAVLLGGVLGARAGSSTLLTAGSPLDRDLGPGRTETHSIDADAGLYVRITIEPHGVSPIVTLLDPAGAVVTQAQDADGRDVPLTVSFIAERGGVHTVRLTARAAQDVGARYRITLDPTRPPTEEDRARVRAERAYSEAIELAAQGTAESRRAALQRYQEAREIRRRLGEAREEADLLSQVGSLQLVLGAPRDARVTFEASLAVSREAHYPRGEAEALNNLAAVSWNLGELRPALEQYEQALPIFSRLGLLRDQAITLNNIATVHKDLGDPRKALELYERALPLRRQAADLRGQAIGLNNMAVAHLMLGEESQALHALEQALPLARAAGDAGAELSVLQTLGALWVGNGESDRALETLGVALELSRRGGNRAGEAYALNRMGDALRQKGDYAQAVTVQLRALELRRALGDPIGESRVLASLARVYRLRGEYTAAEEHLATALRLQKETGNRYGQTYTLLEQGSLWDDLGQWPRAEEAYGQALALSRSTDDVWGEASTRFRMAKLRRAQGDLEEARKSAEAATVLLESIRAKVAGRQSRSSFFVPAQEVYDFLIDLLMAMDAAQPDQGFAERAFAVSERKRARSLLDLLAESRADLFGGADPGRRRQVASLRDRLTARTQEHVRLLGSRPTEERAATNAREMAELAAQYEGLEGKLRADSPSYGALTEGAVAGAGGVKKLLDDRTVLVEFALGEEASYAWAVTRDAVHTVRLAPGREITAAARAVYDAILSARPPHGPAAKDDAAWEAAGAELSRLLLRPLAGELDHDRVVIVPDGILHYVPFGALPDVTGPGSVFLERHEVVLLPSGSALAALRLAPAARRPQDKAVAILADPVFEADDPRVVPALRRRAVPVKGQASGEVNGDPLRAAREVGPGAETASFARLLFSRREADAISAVAPPGSVLRALNFDASRATALSADLARYRIVHFATHGFVNDRHPDLSGLVLSLVDRQGNAQDGFLRLRDVYALHLPVELVVLSGCQTGLGEEIRGEGLVGLVRGFMYAGTPRVVASLWSVEDRATAALMSEFYRRLLGSSRPPAEALRQAQLAIRAQPRWRHPFYWAGFAFQGDWQ